MLVLGTNIAVLLDCSKSSRQCSLPYLLTVSKKKKKKVRRTQDMEVSLLVKSFFEAPVEAVLQEPR